MSSRTYQIHPGLLTQVNKRFAEMKTSQEKLGEVSQGSREKIGHFLKGEPVEKSLFIRICEAMKLTSEELAVELLPTPINNIFFTGVKKFVGRSDLLAEVHSVLNDDTKPNAVALCGMGGLGKTEAAIQYAKNNLLIYPDGVCWVSVRETDAPGQFNIADQIISFCKRLGIYLPNQIGETDHNTVQQCYDQWKGQSKILIIFDDVEYFNQIKDILPRNPRFKVIITTRLNLSGNDSIESIALDVLTTNDSLELLDLLVSGTRITDDLHSSTLVCEFLAGLPLGLELVGRYLESDPILEVSTILSELEELAKKRKTIGHPAFDGDRKSDPTWNLTAERGLGSAFDLTWVRLSENSRILSLLLGRYPITEIHWSHVEGMAKVQARLYPELGEYDKNELIKARKELYSYSLVKPNDEGLYCWHPMTRQYFRYKITDKDYERFGDII